MGICSQCFYQWAVMDEVVQAATVIAAFVFPLGIFHGSCQMHYELLHDSFDTIRVLTIYPFILLGTLLLQMCQAYSGHFNCGLGPLKLLKGEETSHLGLAMLLAVWLQDGSMESFFWLP